VHDVTGKKPGAEDAPGFFWMYWRRWKCIFYLWEKYFQNIYGFLKWFVNCVT